MKKNLFFSILLLLLLPVFSENIMAQSYGNENACEDEWGSYTSSLPCGQEGLTCSCAYCYRKLECDAYCDNPNCPSNAHCHCIDCGAYYNCSSPHDCPNNKLPGSDINGNDNGGNGGSSSSGGGGGGSPSYDCAGVLRGAAYKDNCGTCVGGTTGKQPCTADCNGTWGGSAYRDNCGTCVGGTTGKQPCVKDCNGVWGGKAYMDDCNVCVEGNTGKISCNKDPCLEKNAINNLLNKETKVNGPVRALINYANTSNYEWATAINVTFTGNTWGTSYVINTTSIVTSESSEGVGVGVRYDDNTRTYTIGTIHTHPNDPDYSGVFSVRDVWNLQWFYDRYSSSNDAGKKFLNDNFSVTVIHNERTYTMTVKNWEVLNNRLNSWDEDAMVSLYDIMRNDYNYSREAIFLTIFGDALNLYSSATNSTLNFKPLKIDPTDYKKAINNPCP